MKKSRLETLLEKMGVWDVENAFAGIVSQRDALHTKLQEQGPQSLSKADNFRLAAALHVIPEVYTRARETAAQIVKKRSTSTRLADRFLRAVMPSYLDVKPCSPKIMRAAQASLTAEFRAHIAIWEEDEAKASAKISLGKEIMRAAVLQNPLAIRKPLKLKLS